MDIATIIGTLLGWGCVAVSILLAGSTFGVFVDYPSMMIVIGGAISVQFICFPLKNLLTMPKVCLKAVFNRPPAVPQIISTLVGLAETARRDGLLALEARIAEIDNPFIVLGIQLAVDGTQPEIIEEVLQNELQARATRHKDGKALMDQMGKFAPAFGMIGTLLGLIIMLGNMNDPSSLGPSMAVALITTLYGAIVSNLVCLPLAEKLGLVSRQELRAMDIIIRGIKAIQSGDNPRTIEQKLSAFLLPKERRAAREKAA